MKPKPNYKNEKGITLIALIIMIVILVILSAVVISGITEGGIIGTTETAAEDYNITSYKEQIEQKVRGTIQEYSIRGEEVRISQIAEKLNGESLWVKQAVANTNTDLENEDIIVTTTDGYIFQVYYNNTYGVIFVEYIGKDDGKEFPTIKARFEKRLASILAEARRAERLELIYRGEVAGTPIEKPNGEQKISVEEIGTGWYKVRAVANDGKLRYAWVRATTISEKLTPPEVHVRPKDPNKGEGNDSWYLGPVIVTAEPNNEYAKEMHYTIIENGETKKENEKYEGEIEIEAEGTIRVIIWSVDEEGFPSEEVIKDIKIDRTVPTVDHEEIPEKPKVGDWNKGNVEVIIKGKDSHSGIDGYVCKVVGESISWSEKRQVGEDLKEGEKEEEREKGDTIEVTREGITEITVKVIDKAGNESEEKTIKIMKDTNPPEFEEDVTITKEKANGFTINALATDEVSGNAKNGGQVTYTYYITKDGKEEKIDENTKGTIDVTGLKMDTTYDVRVVVTDPAGNSTEKPGRGKTLANNDPVFTNRPKEKSKTNTTITLTMTAKDDDGDNLTYVIKYGTYDTNGNKEAYLGTKEIPNVTQGVLQEPNIEKLKNYTNYYFEVYAEDTKGGKTEVVKFDVKTYCLATYCLGEQTTTTECNKCKGSGSVTVSTPCAKTVTKPCNGSIKSTHWTYSCGCGATGSGHYWDCSVHGMLGATGSCTSCGAWNSWGSSSCSGTISETCPDCSGTGTKTTTTTCGDCSGEGHIVTTTNCPHDSSVPHYVCEEHNYDGSSEYHS